MQGPLAVSEDAECLDQVAQRPHQDWGKADKLAQIVRRAVKAWLNEDRLTRGLKEVTSNVCSHLHHEIIVSTAGSYASIQVRDLLAGLSIVISLCLSYDRGLPEVPSI